MKRELSAEDIQQVMDVTMAIVGDIFTDDMDEISGMGGNYEKACRKMVNAGFEWMQRNPGDLTVPGDYKQRLSDFIAKVEPGCSGAMHGACMNHLTYISIHSVAEYQRVLRERDKE